MEVKTEDAVVIHTIYDDPTDRPGTVVVRKHYALNDGKSYVDREADEYSTVTDARKALQGRGLVNLGRESNDDPKIVESWI